MSSSGPLTILIIRPNDFEFNKELYYKNLGTLTSDLNVLIEERTIDFKDMMETIVTEIGLTPELMGDSQICYETEDNVYQLCFVSKGLDTTVNRVATYLIGEPVTGTAILLNSKINKNTYTCLPDHTLISDLSTILYSKFVHKGLVLPDNESEPVYEYDYFGHPLEGLEKEENGYMKYKLFDLNFLGFDLGFFSQVLNKDELKVNKRATRLFGKERLYGDTVFFHKLPHEFLDMTVSLYDGINQLSYGSLTRRELRKEEEREGEKLNDLPLNFNRYHVLANRLKEDKKRCDNCANPLDNNKLICSGCYRMRYHDSECQKGDWKRHACECLYNKKI
ncbi:MAG: hypothetical protein Barrevirus2_4 [Barrevirus sp.]|uniref:MYND-type domain-containing protein n=1 Tax=Barrevirus sp. TaxID=2487763 RepID=A0A3G4ZS64_9VIRU|nr:MAG: hypothetical protein Barrevirus2_4 [Barrevirus sp.]